MPRNIHTIECEFEWHVKRILKRLIEEHEDGPMAFDEWLEKNHKAVAHAFLDDVDSWMGLDEAIADARKES